MIYLEDGFTLDGTEKEVRIYVRAVNTGAISSTIYPMLNRGSSALPYRPYGHNATVRSAGAQFLDYNTLSGAQNGITPSIDDDNYIVLNGTATANAFIYVLCNIPSKTNMFISVNNPVSNNNISVYIRDEESTYSSEYIALDTANKTHAFTAARVTISRFVIRIVQGTTLTNFRLRPMLNSGTSAIPWQPYVAPSSALIALTDSLRGIPVTSGGNYTDEDGQQWIADYIYRRVTDGRWMLWRNCGKTEYDGSEDEEWRASVAANNIFVISNISSVPLNGLCNRFKYDDNPQSAGEFEIDSNHSFRFYTELNDVSAWKVWLQSSPLEVVYQLATPTIEELPEDVQTELNGLYTYNLHTDMWNSDNSYMVLKYVADTKSYIDKKISEISDAIIERLN